MRSGAEYFVNPATPAQRRYEALRAYLLDGVSAQEVGRRFGYSPATVYQLASELRSGRAAFFTPGITGPAGPSKTNALAPRVLALRAENRSITEIATLLAADGIALSPQSVWTILRSAGHDRLPRRAGSRQQWPFARWTRSAHAGLCLLMPALVELRLEQLAAAAGSDVAHVGPPLWLELVRALRPGVEQELSHDEALGILFGLSALPTDAERGGLALRIGERRAAALAVALTRRMKALGLRPASPPEPDFDAALGLLRRDADKLLATTLLGSSSDAHVRSATDLLARQGLVYVSEDGVKLTLAGSPVAAVSELELVVPWWQGRPMRCAFGGG